MKSASIRLTVQEGFLKKVFPESKIRRFREQSLIWTHTLTPTPISDSYKVKLHYDTKNGANFYVVEPKLVLAEGKTELPHVYSTKEQRLCLYYPQAREWHEGMLYVKTLIPWASEWLQHYEIWVGTGEWFGGGIHSNSVDIEAEKDKISKSTNTL